MSFFEKVELFPPDPIFGLEAKFKKDKHPNKVDLTVGIYRSEDLKTRTLRSVKEAEKILLKIEEDKAYLPIEGYETFINETQKLIFGEEFYKNNRGKLFGAQTIGGTGALRIGGEFLKREITHHLYISEPTWPNHRGIFEACALEVVGYPYYNSNTHVLDFERLLNFLAKVPERSIITLHACCHNPTGCDPTGAEWKELSSLMLKRKLLPFFDCAYQGFGRGIEEDVSAIRYFAQQGHELLVAASYSKNFGLYGERVGCLSILSRNEQVAQNVGSMIKRLVRVNYSNPPRHGASLVATVLQDVGLKEMWWGEVDHMRRRIEEMRNELYDALSGQFGKDRFSFLKRRNGLFSMLGIEEGQVERMMTEYGVYLTKSGRINLTGLSIENLSYVIESIIKTSR